MDCLSPKSHESTFGSRTPIVLLVELSTITNTTIITSTSLRRSGTSNKRQELGSQCVDVIKTDKGSDSQLPRYKARAMGYIHIDLLDGDLEMDRDCRTSISIATYSSTIEVLVWL